MPGARVLPPFSRDVEFDNVSFAYDPARRRSCAASRLQARAGEVVAIVGSSGAGKTTLVNLLPRFHDVTGGSAAHRRRGCARRHLALVARTDGHRDAGDHPV